MPSGPGRHLEPVFLQPGERPDVRAASSGCHLAPAWHLELVTLQPGERRGVRAAWCQALASRTVWVWVSGSQVSWPGELPVLRATEWALRSGLALPPALVVPQVPLKVAWQQAEVSAGQPDAPVLPRAAESVSVRAAAGPLPEAAAASVYAVAGPLPEAAAVSVHAAAEPRPEAASAPWAQPAAAGAGAEPDASRAAQPAVAVASGETVQQPAEVRRADAVGQLPVAVRPVPWAQQAAAEAGSPGAQRAAVPLALPSEAASVFRQDLILAGPARPRAAARFAHAMRSLQIASRSEPSWQAARNEGWSCGSTSPEGSLTKCWFDEVLE